MGAEEAKNLGQFPDMGEPIVVPFALGIGLKVLAAPWWGRNCKIPTEQKLEPELGSECCFTEGRQTLGWCSWTRAVVGKLRLASHMRLFGPLTSQPGAEKLSPLSDFKSSNGGQSVVLFVNCHQRGRERDRELETSMREKHRSAASCTPPSGDVPATKVEESRTRNMPWRWPWSRVCASWRDTGPMYQEERSEESNLAEDMVSGRGSGPGRGGGCSPLLWTPLPGRRLWERRRASRHTSRRA
ncbi:hypothetical protein QTO34_012138 [Cnephaeus nilssonii]|uniref:Uncharacterized protein n=1 Tax=Cnephaeus nilssonii TaxID=3371016 RepID=A0AA40HD83_CNENI|nr:hypothetical protein QTO34_012138 [Eptesicus nilssonii]